MKNKLILVLCILAASVTRAQSISVKLTANTNSFSVAYSRYPINSVLLIMPDTTTIQLRLPNGTIVTPAQPVSYYKRSDGTAFSTYQAVLAFYDSFMVKHP